VSLRGQAMLEKILSSELKLGIVAGGQLGKMLIQEANKWDISTYVLDEDKECPSAGIANYHVQGSRLDYHAVYNFGKKVDLLTFEIESINIEALLKLKEEGVKIAPDPSILQLFQNKEKQKEFYVKNNLPTSAFNCRKLGK
jgi:5-(carboxyamino)imidazole ribonucleotide synthase